MASIFPAGPHTGAPPSRGDGAADEPRLRPRFSSSIWYASCAGDCGTVEAADGTVTKSLPPPDVLPPALQPQPEQRLKRKVQQHDELGEAPGPDCEGFGAFEAARLHGIHAEGEVALS